MKVFRVVVERDGTTIKEPGVTSTEVIQDNYRYAAETIEEVWVAIEWFRDNPERTVIAVIEEFPAITVLT